MAGVNVFEVLAPGIVSTVQDLGRFGGARYGVATSGALDGFALRAGNLLVGNDESAAAVMAHGSRAGLVAAVLVVAVTVVGVRPFRDERLGPVRLAAVFLAVVNDCFGVAVGNDFGDLLGRLNHPFRGVDHEVEQPGHVQV